MANVIFLPFLFLSLWLLCARLCRDSADEWTVEDERKKHTAQSKITKAGKATHFTVLPISFAFMENFPHSRQPNMLSKKSCNGSTTKSIYDDVFGGPPRFGTPTLSPRVEDYREIFGGFHASRASSIPVLDLPLVDEAAEVFFDVRSSGFDYGEVFGGFNDHDFAVSYNELAMMEQSNGLGDDSSSDEAWYDHWC